MIDETKKAPSPGLLFFLHPLPLSIKGALGSCLALVEEGEAPGLGLVALGKFVLLAGLLIAEPGEKAGKAQRYFASGVRMLRACARIMLRDLDTPLIDRVCRRRPSPPSSYKPLLMPRVLYQSNWSTWLRLGSS